MMVPKIDYNGNNWIIMENEGSGACFQLSLLEWLQPGTVMSAKDAAIYVDGLILHQLVTNPATAAGNLDPWTINMQQWETARNPFDGPWVDDYLWAHIACAFNVTVCMYARSRKDMNKEDNNCWHVCIPDSCSIVIPSGVNPDQILGPWYNVGQTFPLDSVTAPCCIFILYTDSSHYELLRPMFGDIPDGCFWGQFGLPKPPCHSLRNTPTWQPRLEWDQHPKKTTFNTKAWAKDFGQEKRRWGQ